MAKAQTANKKCRYADHTPKKIVILQTLLSKKLFHKLSEFTYVNTFLAFNFQKTPRNIAVELHNKQLFVLKITPYSSPSKLPRKLHEGWSCKPTTHFVG